MKTQRKPRRLSIDSIITEMSVIEGELLRSIVGGYTDDCFWRCIAYIEDGKSLVLRQMLRDMPMIIMDRKPVCIIQVLQ